MPIGHEVVRGQRSRRTDFWGSGQFGASRGGRSHYGLDIETRFGETVYSPIDGDVSREALPYKHDPSLRGLVVNGTGAWAGWKLKVFYVTGITCGPVKAGQPIGTAQNLDPKYPGITNHVHLEVDRQGVKVSPDELFQMCF